MRRILQIAALVGLLVIRAAPWQTVPSDGLVTLRAIKQRMTESLTRIPDYTCLETIRRGGRPPERFVIAAHGKQVPLTRFDVIRLEVAEVAGKEFYARAGDHVFSATHPKQFVDSGLSGTGIFSSFASDIFRTDIANFAPMQTDQSAGRSELRYDFRVPRSLSGFSVGTELGQAIVAFHGTFAADPATRDVLWLELEADDVPAVTGLTATSTRVDYSRVEVGSSRPLLPQSAEMMVRRGDGWENHNQIAFTHCREYGVRSAISFDETRGASNDAATAVELPADVELTMRLETPVDSANAHVGDAIKARVGVDAKQHGVVVVPKGAVVSGRVRAIARHSSGRIQSVVELEWTQIEFEGRRGRLFAELQRVVAPEGTARLRVLPMPNPLPGVGSISAAGDRLRLPAGTRMIWKTSSY